MDQENKELIDFVESHIHEDVAQLSLKYREKVLPFDLDCALTQIYCRQKTRKKLPSILENRSFLFPTRLSSEQASDELVSRYHASLAEGHGTIMDLTAGLGIDAFFMAKEGHDVTLVEIEPLKVDTLRHNAEALSLDNVKVFNEDCAIFLKGLKNKYDITFIDPARRGEGNKRIYSLKECSPDVTILLGDIFAHSDLLLVKASPLADITQISREIPCCSEIHIVCAHGECKEVLVIARKDASLQKVGVVWIESEGEINKWFLKPEDREMSPNTMTDTDEIKPGGFIYEPNAGIMKLQCGGELCKRYEGLKKLSNSTNLYFSAICHKDFPGKILKVESLPSKKDMKHLENEKINTISRNYVMSAEEIARKYKLKPGENRYLVGAKVGKRSTPLLILTTRIADK